MDPEAIATEFATTFAVFTKNYLKEQVSASLVPVFSDTLTQMIGDASGKKPAATVFDSIQNDPNEKQPDMVEFKFAETLNAGYDWFNNEAVLVYPFKCVRVGHKNGDGKKEFFVKGQQHSVSYSILKDSFDAYKQDHKDTEIKFPAECALPGTICFCIPKAGGDLAAHRAELQAYTNAIVAKPSPSMNSFFRMGDDFEAAQASHDALINAFTATCWEVSGLRSPWWYMYDPTKIFNMKDAVTRLLQGFAAHVLAPRLIPPGTPSGTATAMALAPIITACKVPIATWVAGAGPALETADKVAVKIQTFIREEGPALLEKLKPLLEKIFDIIKSKMGETKEAESESPAEWAIGDTCKAFQLKSDSKLGAVLYTELTETTPAVATKNFTKGVAESIEVALNKQLASIDAVLESKFNINIPALSALIGAEMKRISNLVLSTIGYTVFSNACVNLSAGLDAVEKATNADEASAILWKAITQNAMEFYCQTMDLESSISNKFNGSGAEAMRQPFYDLNQLLFEVRCRALNSIRVRVVAGLQFADGKLNVSAFRASVRDISFEVLELLKNHQWIEFAKAVSACLLAWIKNWFHNEAMPTIRSLLDPLQTMIPPPISEGINVADLTETIAGKIFEALVGKLSTKLMKLLEGKIFETGNI
jgi:hypothetical protein